MSRHKDLFQAITLLEEEEVPYAIASVFQVHGSSSGKVGDKAVFDSNGKRIIGYIGGGCIENRVAALAKESIKEGTPKTIEIDLDSDEMGMGIPCGGYMSVIVEPQLVSKTIFIRGVGRVVEILCRLASILKLKVIVQTDENEKEYYSDADKIITDSMDIEDIDFPVDYFILATHHRNDDQVAYDAIKKGISYVGVLASAKKTGIIKKFLINHGINEEEMRFFYSPTGLDFKATTPEQIALSILSEIVMLSNSGSGRHMRDQIEK